MSQCIDFLRYFRSSSGLDWFKRPGRMTPPTMIAFAFFVLLMSCLAYELRLQKSPVRNRRNIWHKPWFRWTTYFLLFVVASLGYLQYTLWNTYGRSSRFDEKARPVYQLVSQCYLPSSDGEPAFNQCVNESKQKLSELQFAATNPGERMLWGRLGLYLEYVVECHEDHKQGRNLDETNSCIQRERASSESLARTLK